MRRRLFNLLTTISLLLCLASIGLWVRSCCCEDLIQFNDHRRTLSTQPHQLWVCWTDRVYWVAGIHLSRPVNARFSQQFGPFLWFTEMPAPRGRSYSALGFVDLSFSQKVPRPCHFTYVAVPCWFLSGMTAIVPLVWLRRQRSQHAVGLCPACGHDLHATPARCPECGTAS